MESSDDSSFPSEEFEAGNLSAERLLDIAETRAAKLSDEDVNYIFKLLLKNGTTSQVVSFLDNKILEFVENGDFDAFVKRKDVSLMELRSLYLKALSLGNFSKINSIMDTGRYHPGLKTLGDERDEDKVRKAFNLLHSHKNFDIVLFFSNLFDNNQSSRLDLVNEVIKSSQIFDKVQNNDHPRDPKHEYISALQLSSFKDQLDSASNSDISLVFFNSVQFDKWSRAYAALEAGARPSIVRVVKNDVFDAAKKRKAIEMISTHPNFRLLDFDKELKAFAALNGTESAMEELLDVRRTLWKSLQGRVKNSLVSALTNVISVPSSGHALSEQLAKEEAEAIVGAAFERRLCNPLRATREILDAMLSTLGLLYDDTSTDKLLCNLVEFELSKYYMKPLGKLTDLKMQPQKKREEREGKEGVYF